MFPFAHDLAEKSQYCHHKKCTKHIKRKQKYKVHPFDLIKYSPSQKEQKLLLSTTEKNSNIFGAFW